MDKDGVDRSSRFVIRIRCSDIGSVRNSLQQSAIRAGLRRASVADFELAASELISNACEHGSFAVAAITRSGECVELHVSNRAAPGSVPPPSEWKLPGPMCITGRGLAVVGILADSATVRWHGDRVTITARFPAGANETVTAMRHERSAAST